MQTARQPLRAIDMMIYHRIMKPVRFIVALWPVLLCAAIWQLLQFAPADRWWWLQKATDPLTTTLIIYATWRYSDRQQSTTRLLLTALVLFVMAGSVMAFLPFAYFIVGLGAFFVVIAEIVSEFRTSGQTPDLLRLFFIATLIAGVLGLKRLKS